MDRVGQDLLSRRDGIDPGHSCPHDDTAAIRGRRELPIFSGDLRAPACIVRRAFRAPVRTFCRVLQSFSGRGKGILGERVRFVDQFHGHMIFRPESAHLSRDLHRQIRSIEGADPPDAAGSADEAVPIFFCSDADRGHCPHAGHNDSFFFFHGSYFTRIW